MWKHGRSAYVHHKCRCPICCDANAAYFSRYRSTYRKTDAYKTYQDAYIAAYRERNRASLLAYTAKYRLENRDAYLKREQSAQGKAHKRQREQRRRAMKLNQFVEDVDPFVLYRSWGGICGICGKPVPEDGFHIDHRVPISRGGLHGYANCQPAHPSCNSRKAARIEPA